MSTVGFATNAETLHVLAWLAGQPQLRQELAQNRTQRPDNGPLIQSWLNAAISPFVQDAVYGPVYRGLFEHRLAQVSFLHADWAVRGFNAVYFAPGQEKEETRCSTEETALLWEVIAQSEHLSDRMKRFGRQWGGDVRRGARVLRACFTLHTPGFLRAHACPFIVQELLRISLERVNWLELAALVLGVPYVPLLAEPLEKEEDEDPLALFAILMEMVWQAYGEFEAYSLSYTPTEFYLFEDEQAAEFQNLCACQSPAASYFDRERHAGEMLMDVCDEEAEVACSLLGESSSNGEEGLGRYQGIQITYESEREEERLRALLGDKRVIFALRPLAREAFLVLSPSYQVQLAKALLIA
jgi:hypothetical protein